MVHPIIIEKREIVVIVHGMDANALDEAPFDDLQKENLTYEMMQIDLVVNETGNEVDLEEIVMI